MCKNSKQKINMMKKILLVIFLFIISTLWHMAHAQDIIYKKDNSQIKCKVMKVGSVEIEYKKWENVIEKNEVLLITYENGTSEVMPAGLKAEQPKKETEYENDNENTQEQKPLKTNESKEDYNPLFESTYGFYGSLSTGGTYGFYTDGSWGISKNKPWFITLGYGLISDFDLIMFSYIPLNIDYRIKLNPKGSSYLGIGGGAIAAFSDIWIDDYSGYYSGYWETTFGVGIDLSAYISMGSFRIGTTIPITGGSASGIFNIGFAF
jgi:hypothetical protein